MPVIICLLRRSYCDCYLCSSVTYRQQPQYRSRRIPSLWGHLKSVARKQKKKHFNSTEEEYDDFDLTWAPCARRAITFVWFNCRRSICGDLRNVSKLSAHIELSGNHPMCVYDDGLLCIECARMPQPKQNNLAIIAIDDVNRFWFLYFSPSSSSPSCEVKDLM